MSKQNIQNKFQMGNEVYTLVYFPDPKDTTQIEPNFSTMQAAGNGVKEVMLPDGTGGTHKKHMCWIRAFVPANAMTPQKNFLLFALLDIPVPPESLAPNSMICYAVQEVGTVGENIQQQFINNVIGVQHSVAAKEHVKDDWATNMFESPAEVIEDVDASTE